MGFYVVIPARFASSRLPGKPLADIAGKPMIQHVYERASQSSAARVIVATDDSRVFDAVKTFGGEVCMTSSAHTSGTDRLQEMAAQYGFADTDIVVNVQGDEPLIPAAVIDQVAENISANPAAAVATLCEPIESFEDFINPNVVKVVASDAGMAQYFSRAPIPWPRDHFADECSSLPQGLSPRRHIGIYAYRVALLNRFVSWLPAQLEQWESLEQLRVLANGEQIHVDDACAPVPGGVDTPEDLSAVRAELESADG